MKGFLRVLYFSFTEMKNDTMLLWFWKIGKNATNMVMSEISHFLWKQTENFGLGLLVTHKS